MPNWKKVIVSGSDAALNSLLVTNGVTITGSLNVTGSTIQIGNNTLLGNTTLSGSTIISGSENPSTPSVQIYGDTQHTGVVRFNPISRNIDPSISASYIYVSGSTNDLYFTQNGAGYANTTRLRWLEGNLYTGLLNGGLITSASSTTFNISSGSGIIVSLNASLNDNPYPTVQYVNWGNLTNQSLTYLTSSIQTFVGINSAGTVIQQTDPWNDGQYNTSISIGTILHQNTSSINGTISYPNVAYGYKQRTYDFIKAFGPLKLSGYIIYPSSSLGLTVGSGTAWADGRNYQTDPNNPSYITDPGTNVSKIFRYHVSGSTYIQDTNGGLGYTVIDPSQYNNNGVLTPISPSTPWSNQRVFYYPNSVTKGIVVYYGSKQYGSQTEAVANLQYEDFQETPNTQQNAIYLGTITIKYNGTFTTPNDYVILPGGIFRNVGGSGGGGAVTSTLSGLSDVSIVGPTNGQPLVYSSASLKWENQSTLTANLVGNASTATTASYALTASYTPSIAGTDNYIPRFNGSSALENSVMYDDGTNIGIGTTSPGQKLHVAGNISASIFYPAGAGGNYIQGDGSGLVAGGPSYFYSAGSGGSYFEGQVRIRGALANDTAAYMQINGGTSNYTYINGSLGIGTSSPSTTLALAGATATTFGLSLTPNGWNGAKHRFTVPTSGDTSMWSFNWNGSTTDASYATSAITLGQGLITFATTGSANTPAERMRIDSSGNVGIGTSSPPGNSTNRAVEIAGADSANLVVTQPGYASAAFTSFNSEAYIGTSTNHPFYLYTNGSERLRIANNGAIKFNAYGSGTFTGTATQKLAVDSSGNVIEIPIGAGPVDGSGTANYITRWVDTDTITTSSIYESSGNIGIGTTSPSYKLHVVGTLTSTGDTILANATNVPIKNTSNYPIFEGQSTSAQIGFSRAGTGDITYIGSDSTYLFRLWDESFGANYFNVLQTGNIGIGTASPSYKLSVVAASTSDGIQISYGGSSKFVANGDGVVIWGSTADAGVLSWDTGKAIVKGQSGYALSLGANNGTDQLYINTSGNVGIGTTSPAYKLSVVGKIALNDGGNSVFVGENAGQSDDATANVNVGVGYNALQNNLTGNQNVAVGHKAAATQTAAANNTAVGANALELNTTGASTTAIGSYALNNNIVGTSNTAVGTAALLFNTSGSRNIAFGSSALRFNTSGSRNIAIGTAALYENVTGSNNVMIGDNTGRYYSTGTSAMTDASASIFIGNNNRASANNSLNEIIIGTDIVGLGNNSVVLGNDNITTTALKGNVGIGTTSPGFKLNLYSSTTTEPTLIGTNTNPAVAMRIGHGYDASTPNNVTAKIEFTPSAPVGYYGDDITFSTSTQVLSPSITDASTERMRITKNGNVGIGTTSPSYKLHVYEYSGTSAYFDTPGGGYVRFTNGYIDSNSSQFGFRANSGTKAYIGANDSQHLTIDTSGNVGIGTTSPSYLLDVNGTARVTTLIETSAAKYKTNIQPLEPQLSKVTQLEPVTFDWIDKPNPKTNIGLIADEVEKIYPEFVSKTEDDEIEGIEYSKLTTVLIQSIKELKEIVDKQQEQINTLLNK